MNMLCDVNMLCKSCDNLTFRELYFVLSVVGVVVL